jgi:hypothetical protein
MRRRTLNPCLSVSFGRIATLFRSGVTSQIWRHVDLVNWPPLAASSFLAPASNDSEKQTIHSQLCRYHPKIPKRANSLTVPELVLFFRFALLQL